jgi:hypothetical protein
MIHGWRIPLRVQILIHPIETSGELGVSSLIPRIQFNPATLWVKIFFRALRKNERSIIEIMTDTHRRVGKSDIRRTIPR